VVEGIVSVEELKVVGELKPAEGLKIVEELESIEELGAVEVLKAAEELTPDEDGLGILLDSPGEDSKSEELSDGNDDDDDDDDRVGRILERRDELGNTVTLAEGLNGRDELGERDKL